MKPLNLNIHSPSYRRLNKTGELTWYITKSSTEVQLSDMTHTNKHPHISQCSWLNLPTRQNTAKLRRGDENKIWYMISTAEQLQAVCKTSAQACFHDSTTSLILVIHNLCAGATVVQLHRLLVLCTDIQNKFTYSLQKWLDLHRPYKGPVIYN